MFMKIFKFIKSKFFYKKNGFYADEFRKMVEVQKFMESCPRSSFKLGD